MWLEITRQWWSFFVPSWNVLFQTSCLLDGEEHLLVSSFLPDLAQVLECFFVISGKLKISLEVSIFKNSTHKVILIDIGNFVLSLGDDGNLNSWRGRGCIFVFLVCEDVNSDNGGLGGSVLSWLGSGVLGNLAGMSLEHAVASLLDGASLCGFTVRRTSLCLLEFFVVGHLLKLNICWFESNSFINTHHNPSKKPSFSQ